MPRNKVMSESAKVIDEHNKRQITYQGRKSGIRTEIVQRNIAIRKLEPNGNYRMILPNNPIMKLQQQVRDMHNGLLTWRFSPTPGRFITDLIPRAFNLLKSPTPESSSNWGVLNVPPESITSPLTFCLPFHKRKVSPVIRSTYALNRGREKTDSRERWSTLPSNRRFERNTFSNNRPCSWTQSGPVDIGNVGIGENEEVLAISERVDFNNYACERKFSTSLNLDR